MDTIIFLLFAFMYGVLLLYSINKLKFNLSSILLLVIIALIYDNLIIGIGIFIGEGNLLETLNIVRFWLHTLFTPTLIIFSYAILRESKVPWVQSTITFVIAVFLTLVAIIVEFFSHLKNLKVSPTVEYGALSYTSATEQVGAPIMIILVMIALLIASIIFIKRFNWWWMLLGVIVMGIGAVPIQINSNALTNLLELILIFMLVLTKKRVDQKNL